jgi:methyl-accepting chemotaxis protein
MQPNSITCDRSAFFTLLWTSLALIVFSALGWTLSDFIAQKNAAYTALLSKHTLGAVLVLDLITLPILWFRAPGAGTNNLPKHADPGPGAKPEMIETKVEVRERTDMQVVAEKEARLRHLAETFERDVATVVSVLTSTARDLEENARRLEASASGGGQRAAAVASASEQTAANVETVAGAAEELSASISEIGRQVEESANRAREAAERARDASSNVTTLNDNVQKIDDVVRLIETIAKQTNLLALNATIEAARAGEAGRGFAVVANEVKALAGQTAQATGEISARINSIRESTDVTVTSIKRIVGAVEEVSEISSIIAAAVQEQNATTEEIARNVHQASSGTREVSGAIEDVRKAAVETNDLAVHTLSNSVEVKSLTEGMKSKIETFMKAFRNH